MVVAALTPTQRRVLCGYCLGAHTPERLHADAGWCGDACTTAVARARAYHDHGDLPAVCDRRQTSAANATGWPLSPRETRAADLRVRCLGGEPVETLAQWEAVDALPGGPARLGHTAESWAALGADLRAARDDVRAWLARQPLLPGEPR